MTNVLHWAGVLLPREAYRPAYLQGADALADAARDGDWDGVLRRLTPQTVNAWRPGGQSWFTPLHQAAWHGAPVEVVRRLLGAGAVRSLTTADGDRAVDLARSRRHDHLVGLLEPAYRAGTAGPETLDLINGHLDAHLASITEQFRDGAALRPFDLRLISEEGGPQEAWLHVSGMYGGVRIGTFWGHAHVHYTSRMSDAFGDYSVVTTEGVVKVKENDSRT